MRRWRGPGLAIACSIVVALLIAIPTDAQSQTSPSAPAWGPSSTHIKHIVIVMMENHAFDNFFGTYCTTPGPYCKSAVHGEPAGLCVPNNPAAPHGACTKPYPLGVAGFYTHDLAHDWNSTHKSINNGKMNGFYQAEMSGALPFGYFNASTIPFEWDLAEEYGLGDDFFSSTTSYSLPNHWDLVAGQVPQNGVNLSLPGNGHQTPLYKHTYLNSANTTPSIENLLNASPSVSWKYYDWALPAYNTSITGGWGNLGAYNYWNPMAASAQSYSAPYAKHFVDRETFFNAAASGSLPDLSYVIPGAAFSDHPQLGNLSTGQAFLAQVVDAVEESPEWSSTALFITWDEYGGWYDGVAPPTLDALGAGIRVPLIVVSPFTPVGRVVHTTGYFESLLHFVEWRFGLGCLTSRDCNAPLPFDYFNFNQTRRAPILFATNWTNSTYPMPLQNNHAVGIPCPNNCSITPSAWVNPPSDEPMMAGVDYS